MSSLDSEIGHKMDIRKHSRLGVAKYGLKGCVFYQLPAQEWHIVFHTNYQPRYRCQYDGCSAAFCTIHLVDAHIFYNHLKIKIEGEFDGCGVKFVEESGWSLRLRLNHSGVEIGEHILALLQDCIHDF